MKKISTKKMTTGKFIGLSISILIFIILCSHIAIQDVATVDSESNLCFTKHKEAKTTGQVNEMLFSIKSFILFE